jgi:hypothetical protein
MGDFGRVGKADQALAVPATPANAVDGPSGFDPSRITELVATIEAKVLAPFIKKAADELYCSVLDTAEDYFRDNLDWNLRGHLEMLQRENQRMRTELYEADRIIGGNYLSHADRIERLRALDKASVERMMLLMAVEQKHDGETRYETALRYIRERGDASRIEARSDEPLQAAQPEGQEPDGEAGTPKTHRQDTPSPPEDM